MTDTTMTAATTRVGRARRELRLGVWSIAAHQRQYAQGACLSLAVVCSYHSADRYRHRFSSRMDIATVSWVATEAVRVR